MTSLAEQIEAHLISEKDWVPTRELCAMFGIKERQLRRIGGQPGLCSNFAISKNGAFRHVYFASEGEWNEFHNRVDAHAKSELKRLGDLNKLRHDATRIFRARHFEKDTGQAVMTI